jgi:hypothetical protein
MGHARSSSSPKYPDTLIEFRECSHPDPDEVCDNCNCWKINPFGYQHNVDFEENTCYKEPPFRGVPIPSIVG